MVPTSQMDSGVSSSLLTQQLSSTSAHLVHILQIQPVQILPNQNQKTLRLGKQDNPDRLRQTQTTEKQITAVPENLPPISPVPGPAHWDSRPMHQMLDPKVSTSGCPVHKVTETKIDVINKRKFIRDKTKMNM